MLNKKFKSVYAEYIISLISSKTKQGFKYKKETGMFMSIDRLAVENDEKGPGLTKEFCDKWLNSSTNQTIRTKYDRCCVLRSFSSYLIDLDVISYLPTLPRYIKNPHIPYIYTQHEIASIFKASDSLRLPLTTNTGLFSIPAFIRFLYATGVRLSEARLLKNDDVNLLDKYVKIKDGKNLEERLIPISDSLVDVLHTYLWYKKQLINSKGSEYFFVKTDGSELSSRLIETYFKRCLNIAGIYGDDKLVRPRLHDLRHTFAVNSLVKIIESGNDTYVALPILSKYLGHKSVSATNGYVRLTANIYPEIIRDIDLYILDVFPKNEKL
jgi:integrase/recombinase XerD